MRTLTLLLLTLPVAALPHEAPLHHAHPHGVFALVEEGAALALALAALGGVLLLRARGRR